MSGETVTPTDVIDNEAFLEKSLYIFQEGSMLDERLFSPERVRQALEYFGAKFDKEVEGYEELRHNTNKTRRPGMDAIWGKEIMDNFNRYTNLWAEGYEEVTGKSLPHLVPSGKKTSGMRHLLGELTAYAAGYIKPEDLQNRLRIRFANGKAFAEERNDDREKLDLTRSGNEGKMLGSIPPTFIDGLLSWLESARPKE